MLVRFWIWVWLILPYFSSQNDYATLFELDRLHCVDRDRDWFFGIICILHVSKLLPSTKQLSNMKYRRQQTVVVALVKVYVLIEAVNNLSASLVNCMAFIGNHPWFFQVYMIIAIKLDLNFLTYLSHVCSSCLFPEPADNLHWFHCVWNMCWHFLAFIGYNERKICSRRE